MGIERLITLDLRPVHHGGKGDELDADQTPFRDQCKRALSQSRANTLQ